MNYEILFIQGAGEVTRAEEQVIADALKTELGDDFAILLPTIKDADQPTYLAWENALITNLNSLPGKVILLGHSFGASVILKHFSREPVPDKVIGMILFGVPYWKDQNWDVSEYEIEDDFLANLSKLDNIYFYHSTDDEVIPYEQFKSYQKLIPKAHWKVLSGMNHSYHGAIPDMIQDIQDLAGASGS
ncbi:MAG TPA: alpha/beta hydrolase [Pedobacter sp.]|uniref:alpha/beta hydrolase n=1 Tax=Pedobacter sp. TaxID=1411316 RepID=UPI002B90C73F|nr:alpha/beta hydrolase [Pedobacter sp.]HMI04097.1 alpha/beta hydrolase [Pedobacter sp.]